MAYSKDFNGNPVMPGIDEDAFFDFDSAADPNTVPLPLPQMDNFGSNGSTSAYGGGSFNSQLSSTAPLEFTILDTAPRFTGQTGMGNGTTWNTGGFQHKSSRNTVQLTEEELQIIMAIRTAKQKTAESAISLLPAPVNKASYDFSSPEHPGQVDRFGALKSLSPWGTLELSTDRGDMQNFGTPETFSIGHIDDIQSNSDISAPIRPNSMTEPRNEQQPQVWLQGLPWLVGERCPRTGCSSIAKFKSLGALRRHIKNFHDEPLICLVPNCLHKKPFARPTDLRRHVNSVHPDSDDTKHPCQIDSCGGTYSRKDYLVKHLREKHGIYVCRLQHCPHGTKNRFSTEEEAKEHVHNDHGVFECAIKACAMAPSSRFTESSLKLHVQTHHRVSDYVDKDLSWMKETNVYSLSPEHLRGYNARECRICDKAGYLVDLGGGNVTAATGMPVT